METASDSARSDAARNRERLLEAARRLVVEHGPEHVTMREVAAEAGVGKGTLFRRFGDRDGLLLALLDDAEADFLEAYTAGPPPLGPGAPAPERLVTFGQALIQRTVTEGDLGSALARELLPGHRNDSGAGTAFRAHVAGLLRESGVEADHELLALVLLSSVSFETLDHLRGRGVSEERLHGVWADLVRRVTHVA
ncbi:helix-turn-helix transcriptional regulator [Streptomyces roseirectus]|uniref:Helix-turn-helix transcriptional regulator n=1 Tax=Streptomyces roseirectus TaxID=2768066 RepID=A0A7H0INP5_9ACTN|nr:helix-turn-helix domain-containing protein [Streptomyces roseirectus]QNP74411.1 helix-turn-helix transcriptional regulator [Streptomyces roseirectus]